MQENSARDFVSFVANGAEKHYREIIDIIGRRRRVATAERDPMMLGNPVARARYCIIISARSDLKVDERGGRGADVARAAGKAREKERKRLAVGWDGRWRLVWKISTSYKSIKVL
jgi:hypothetical protein